MPSVCTSSPIMWSRTYEHAVDHGHCVPGLRAQFVRPHVDSNCIDTSDIRIRCRSSRTVMHVWQKTPAATCYTLGQVWRMVSLLCRKEVDELATLRQVASTLRGPAARIRFLSLASTVRSD